MSQKLSLKSTLLLHNGVAIPRLGLGTWQAEGNEAEQAVLWALEAGYRHIDTANIYDNECDIAAALQKTKIPRKEIFVTSKLWNSDHRDPLAAFEASILRLGLDYLDLYLIHWPVEERVITWRTLQTLVKNKKCRALGVSNFTIPHLRELISKTGIIPAVNQVELTPYLYQKDLLVFCKEQGIVVEAYSPLTRGKKLNDTLLVSLARHYKKSPAQILIRWGLQHDLVVLPKSVTRERIIENVSVFDFEIAPQDMQKLNDLNQDLRFCWNPETFAQNPKEFE